MINKCVCATEAPHDDRCYLSERNKAAEAERLARGDYKDVWEKIAHTPFTESEFKFVLGRKRFDEIKKYLTTGKKED